MSSSLIANSPLVTQASRQTQQLTQHASVLGKEASTQKRDVGNISPVDVVIGGIYNNQLATLTGCDSGINNSVAYLQNALASLQEEQTLLQASLGLATQVATNPGVQSSATLMQLNGQYQTQINQIQQVVTTSHDAVGNLFLNGAISSFTAGAATPLNALIGNAAPVAIGQASFAAATITNVNNAITGALAANLGVAATSVASVTASLLSAASSAIASTGTVAEYLSYAMSVIPTIGMNSSQVQQQFNDTIRTQQLIALLPQLLIDSGLYTGIAIAGKNAASTVNNEITNIVAAMTNSAVPVAGNVHQTIAGVTPNTTTTAAFAALLTPAEKANLIAACTGAGPLDLPVAGAGTVTDVQLYTVLSYIGCLTNVNGGVGTINGVGAAAGPLLNAAGVGTTALSNNANIAGAAQGGVATATQPAGNANPLAVIQAIIYARPLTQTTVNAYPLTAAVSLINNPTTIPQKVQIGLNSSDTVSLQINNTNTTALNIASTNVLTLAGAQTAVQNLQKALDFINATIANINGQVNQLTARDTSINTQVDSLNEQIALIEDTDLVENASQLNGINSAIATVGALIQLSAAIRQTIAQAAQQILRG